MVEKKCSNCKYNCDYVENHLCNGNNYERHNFELSEQAIREDERAEAIKYLDGRIRYLKSMCMHSFNNKVCDKYDYVMAINELIRTAQYLKEVGTNK